MNTITFPGLGLTFHLNRVAFSIGSFHVYWYGVIIAIGFAAAAVFCAKQAKHFGLKTDDFLDMLILAAPCGIIGARLYYIIFNPTLYQNPDGSLNLAACFNVHNGGLAIYGGIIAGTLIAFLVARHKKIPFPALIDLCAFGLLIGQIAGRWGNFVNAEAYGGPTDLPWRMGIETIADGSVQVLEVHPTFLYESLWNLVGFILLLWIFRKGYRKFDGMMFLLYVIWYGFGRGCIEGLRTDSLYLFSTGIRTSQLLGFLSCAVAVILLIWNLSKHPDPQNLYVNRVKQKGEPQSHDLNKT